MCRLELTFDLHGAGSSPERRRQSTWLGRQVRRGQLEATSGVATDAGGMHSKAEESPANPMRCANGPAHPRPPCVPHRAAPTRPTLLQWLRYSYTGVAPRKNAACVLFDATCRTWVPRHVVRYLFLIGPFVAAVMVFLPTTMALRTETCLAAGLSIGLGYLCYTVESLEARIEKAGYPRGLAAEMRHRRSEETHRAVVARSRARREARLQRHI